MSSRKANYQVPESWTLLPADKSEIVPSLERFLSAKEDSELNYLMKDIIIKELKKVVHKELGFRPQFVDKLSANQLFQKVIMCIARTTNYRVANDLRKYLAAIYTMGELQEVISDFLKKLDIPHNKGIIDNQQHQVKSHLQEHQLEEAITFFKETKPHHISSLKLVMNVFYENDSKREVWPTFFKDYSDKIEIVEYLKVEVPNSNKVLSQALSEEVVREENIDVFINDNNSRLDDMLLIGTINSAAGVYGAFSYSEMEDLIEEVLKLNNTLNYHYRYFHKGYLHALHSKNYSFEEPEVNHRRLKHYHYGFMAALARKKEFTKLTIIFEENLNLSQEVISETTNKHIGINLITDLFKYWSENEDYEKAALLVSKKTYLSEIPSIDGKTFQNIFNETVQHLDENDQYDIMYQLLEPLIEDGFEAAYAQAAYCYQMKGNFASAIKLYEKQPEVLKWGSLTDRLRYELCKKHIRDERHIRIPRTPNDYIEMRSKLSPVIDFLEETSFDFISGDWIRAIYYGLSEKPDERGKAKIAIDNVVQNINGYSKNKYLKHDMEAKGLFLSALINAELENLDTLDRSVDHLKDALSRSPDLRAPSWLWERLILAIEYLDEVNDSGYHLNQTWQSIYSSDVRNKLELLSLFESETIRNSSDYIYFETLKWSKMEPSIEKAEAGISLISKYSRLNLSKCIDLYDELEEMLYDPNVDKSSLVGLLTQSKNNAEFEILFQHDPISNFYRGISLLKELGQPELDSLIINKYDRFIESLISSKGFEPSCILSLIEERNEISGESNWNEYTNKHSVNLDSSFEAFVSEFDTISVAWFGATDKIVKKVINELSERYPGKFCLEHHCPYDVNGGSGCSSKAPWQSMIKNADVVIIHTMIRTNFGGQVREYSNLVGKDWMTIHTKARNPQYCVGIIERACKTFLSKKEKKKQVA